MSRHTAGRVRTRWRLRRREVRWILRDPVARFLLFGVPVIAFALLGFTFSSAVVRGLDVVVVDMDNSATSRLFVQTLAAVARHLGRQACRRPWRGGIGDPGRARHRRGLPAAGVRQGCAGRPRAARGLVLQHPVLHAGEQRGQKHQRRAERGQRRGGARAARWPATMRSRGPDWSPEEYVLANPALNYAQFLLRAVLPTVLHVVVAISAGLAVGSEFRRRSLRAWWDISGHNIATALVGKLLPYFVVHMLMFVLMVGILDVWLGVSFRGSVLLMTASATLLIVAYQLIGCLMQLLARNMAVGLSLTGLIVSPAFGYAGVGFPVLAMGAFPRAWGAILPLRWYIQILFDQASRGAAVRITSEPFAMLSGLTIVLALLVWLRFRALVRRGLAHPRGGRDRAAGSGARHRRRVCRGVAARAGRSRCARAVRAGAGALRRLLPAALSRPDRAQRADCGGRPRQQRTRPRADPDAGGARQHPRGPAGDQLPGGGGRDLRPPRFRDPGHPRRYREECAEGRHGAAAGLCRFDLLHPVQPRAAGHARIGAGLCKRMR